MDMPFNWYTQIELNAESRLLPPRNLKTEALVAYAQSVPQQVGDAVFTTKVTWDRTTKYITCDNDPYVLYLPECDGIDVAYDQLNRLNVAWLTGGDVWLYWYDAAVAAFVTTNFGPATSFAFLLDDVRHYSVPSSTMVLFYTNGDTLYYRVQADRFTVEYIAIISQDDITITNAGLCENLRLQICTGVVEGADLVDYIIQVDSAYVVKDNSYLGEMFE